MNAARNRLNINHLLVYLGLLALVFLCGLGLGGTISGWRPQPPGPPPVSFVTATPAPTGARTLPGGTPCGFLPDGWIAYTVQFGDTLSDLATRAGVSQELIQQVNCLSGSQLLADQPLFLPPLPTPTPCFSLLPAGWESYLVQSGDTLFNLATTRGANIEQVIRVNCLTSEKIEVGKTLYLPTLPTPIPIPTVTPPLLPSPTPAPVAAAPTPVSTPSAPTPAPTVSVPTPTVPVPTASPTVLLPTFTPDVGPGEITPIVTPISTLANPLGPRPVSLKKPGDSNAQSEELRQLKFVPCSPDNFVPQDIPTLDMNFKPTMEIGERSYFFLCNSNTHPISATVTRSDGLTQQVLLRETMPNPRLQITETMKAVIDWPALPYYPIGQYTLTVTFPITNDPPVLVEPFWVTSPTTNTHILVDPPAGLPGATFLIYYVNFTSTLTHTFDLYSQDQFSVDRGDDKLYHRIGWQVRMTRPLIGNPDRGWTVMSLSTPVTDPRVIYGIGYEGEIRQPAWLFGLR